jgi:two-component system, cell cycle sensor histidine kinase and response regulator CckA
MSRQKDARAWSIQTRLLLVCLGVAAFGSLATITASLLATYQQGRAQVLEQLGTIAQLKAQQIGQWVDQLHVEARLSLSHHDEQLTRQLLLTTGSRTTSLDELRQSLQEAVRDADSLDQLLIVDLHGCVIVCTDAQLEGASRRLYNWFERGLCGPCTITTEQTFSASGARMDAILTIEPIVDQHHRLIGLLAARARAEHLYAIMQERTGLDTSGESYLVNTANILITDSRYPSYQAGAAFVHSPAIELVLQTRQGQRLRTINYHHVPVLSVSHWLPRLDLAMLVEQDQAVALAPIYDNLYANLIAASTILIIALGLAIYLARDFTQPILDLVQAVTHLREGEWGKQARITRRDELGLLAITFNRMSARLSHAFTTIKRREKHMQQVLSSMPVLLDAYDDQGLIVEWNEECERVTGYSAEEIVGNPEALKLLYPDADYRQEMLDSFAAIHGDYRYLEFTLTTKSGVQRTITWSSVSVSMPIPGWSRWAIGIDVTDRYQLENQLRQSVKMDAIGQLAGGIAHDFNNQLSGILGFAELLSLQLADPKLIEYANGIQTAAERSADLTRQLLAFARKGKFRSESVDLHALIEETVQILGRSIDKRINVKTKLSASRSVTQGDASQLQSALLNLGVNARDAMPEGGQLRYSTTNIELTEHHPPSLKPGHYLEIHITDSGCGMSDEVKQHLFEPFFTTKTIGKGTGMGLASVYGIVTNHGGHIHFESAVGIGTTAHLLLPLITTDEDDPENSTDTRLIHRSLHILMVDDEPIMRATLRAMLKKSGHRTTEAENGKQAVLIYQADPDDFDLVILDLVMPEMDGADCFHALRSINGQVKVLIASGFSLDGKTQELLNAGAIGFLQKPFHRRELLNQIETSTR